jgi:hypothetical protein
MGENEGPEPGTWPQGRSWMWGYMDEIAAAGARLVEAEAALWEAVRFARGRGLSWTEVGTALNCTRQAAHERFSKPPRGKLT